MILQQELYRIIVIEQLETAETLADVAGCATSTMYAYAEGRRKVPFQHVKRLRRYLQGKPSCPDLAECLLEPDEKIVALAGAEVNGDVDDQIAPIIEALGHARQHFRDGDLPRYREAIKAAERELDTLRAEGHLMQLQRHG